MRCEQKKNTEHGPSPSVVILFLDQTIHVYVNINYIHHPKKTPHVERCLYVRHIRIVWDRPHGSSGIHDRLTGTENQMHMFWTLPGSHQTKGHWFRHFKPANRLCFKVVSFPNQERSCSTAMTKVHDRWHGPLPPNPKQPSNQPTTKNTKQPTTSTFQHPMSPVSSPSRSLLSWWTVPPIGRAGARAAP